MTGRAAVLALVLLGLLLTYAYPLRVYLAQQAEISALQQHLAKQRAQNEALTEQRAKWDDKTYIMSQARRRLQYVLPGETPYVVIDSNAQQGTPGAVRPDQPKQAEQPWYGKLWSSIEAADHK